MTISIEALKKLNFLKDSSDAVLRHLATDMIEKRFSAGELILKEGEQSDAIYLIADGVAVVEKSLDKKQERSKVVARLEKEEIFGEMSFLEKKPLSASIRAEGSILVYILRKAQVEQLMQSDSAAAIDQILAIFSGISGRLRQTTTELVTVFEVARLLMQDDSFESLVKSALDQVSTSLGEDVPLAFYRWNLFNNEYDLVYFLNGVFPETVSKEMSERTDAEFIWKPIQFGKNCEGLLAFSAKTVFDSGARQMIDTVSGLLAPALTTWRLREEEDARTRFEKSRQENFYS